MSGRARRSATRIPTGVLFSLAVLAAWGFGRADVSVDLAPPIIEETVREGRSLKGTIEYTNKSTQPLRVRVDVVDFDVGPENQVLEKAPGTDPSSLAAYLRVSPSSTVVAPGQQVFFRYVVRSPEDFTHLRGMVYFVSRPELSEQVPGQVLFVARMGVPFYVESFGAAQADLRVRNLTWARKNGQEITLEVDVVNEGQRIFRPPGIVEVRSADGRYRNIFPFNPGREPVLPGHRRRFESSVGPLPEGEFVLRLHMGTSPSRSFRSPAETITGGTGFTSPS